MGFYQRSLHMVAVLCDPSCRHLQSFVDDKRLTIWFDRQKYLHPLQERRSQSTWNLPRGVSAQCRWESLCRHSSTTTPVSGWVSYPESQSGYRKNRRTVDGIFALRQIMEKSREQEHNLHINRELLLAILEKLGCPAKLSRVIKKLYTNVHARLITDGELPGAYQVQQWC